MSKINEHNKRPFSHILETVSRNVLQLSNIVHLTVEGTTTKSIKAKSEDLPAIESRLLARFSVCHVITVPSLKHPT